MIADARGVSADGTEADLCIVGAGPAGITLALELERTGVRILLLEAGGHRYEDESQRLMEGETAGDGYHELRDTRQTGLGGSTGVWAGYCRMLEPEDFEPWPFDRDALLPCYRRAYELCGLPPSDGEQLPDGDGLLLTGDPDVRNVAFHLSPLGFGTRFRGRLEQSANITVLLHAPVMRLVMGDAGSCVSHAVVRVPGGRDLAVRARRFVLAAGGIENPRLLLLSAEHPDRAPGNARGLVGRYFMEHPFLDPGTLVLRQPGAPLDSYFPRRIAAGEPSARVRVALSPGGAACLFYPRYEGHPAFATREVKAFLEGMAKLSGKAVPGGAARHFARAFRAPHHVATALVRKALVGHGPAHRWRMRAMFASEPRPGNRVTLSPALDPLGRPRARLEWRLGDDDIERMRAAMRRVDRAVRRVGLGHVELAFEDSPAAWRAGVTGGKHHMGTTRMHRDPAHGVVDEDGRVHDVGNLFIAGSSVFPSSGYANPTLTIVALAARLAERLRPLPSAVLRATL